MECRHFRFTNYKIFLPQTKITFLVPIRIRPSLLFFSPLNLIINFPFFQAPYVLAKFSHIFGALVPERTCMVSVAFLKCCVTQSNVCFFCLWSCDLCLIYNAPDITIFLRGQVFLLWQLQSLSISSDCFNGLLIWALLCRNKNNALTNSTTVHIRLECLFCTKKLLSFNPFRSRAFSLQAHWPSFSCSLSSPLTRSID